MSTWTKSDTRDFESYCAQASDAQLYGILEKERERRNRHGAGAVACIRAVREEMLRRGIEPSEPP